MNMEVDDEGGQDQKGTTSDVHDKMLHRVANSDAHFKHQQRGEPDLSYDEKRQIAHDILNKNPATFLQRFSKHLEEEDLKYFSPMKDDYEIDFHLQEIRQRLNDRQNTRVVKNRRFRAMQEMHDKGDYFTDDEMKKRDPFLYDQMIGQFLTEDEVQAQIDKTDLTFSNILLSHIQMQHNNVLFAVQKDIEEGQMEEEEEDDEEEEEEMKDEDAEGKEKKIDDTEKALLRAEFVKTMEERFIAGDDPGFDYSEVDENTAYDALDIVNRDAEERYFDDEDELTINSESSQGSMKAKNDCEEVEDYETYQVPVEASTSSNSNPD